MWCSISRFFNKSNVPKKSVNEDSRDSIMDRGDNRRTGIPNEGDRLDNSTKQAKQRATIKWLLSKAFNNSVPENLREPFYRDHEDQEHLKPQLVHLLANAELYCLALGNIYSDPNYHNMNHSGVLQVLLRKGVFVCDSAPTETVLIQTNPIKLSAHLTVMEAVMSLYAKEVATSDRVLAAVQRFSQTAPLPSMPVDHEQALLLWVNKAMAALKERIKEESRSEGNQTEPEFSKLTEFQDLSDGVSIACLIAFYCPEELPWRKITISKVPTMSDRVRNLMLVYEFCNNSLPYSVFHMTPEDVSYMREFMKQNLVVFLADLFNVLEIHPAKCVRFDCATTSLTQAYPRNSQGVAHKRCLPQSVSAIPDLRSSLDSHSSFSGSPVISGGSLKKSHSIHQSEVQPEIRNDEQFVVHRGKGVPTLSSVQYENNSGNSTPVRSAKAEPAGKPSNWEDSRRSSYAGRRSRRNSLSDDSQLTLENFGGSQENLHLIGRNPDKEPAVHVGRRDSSASRSSLNDNKSTALHNALQEQNGDVPEVRKIPIRIESHETRDVQSERSSPSPSPGLVKKTTFAALPQSTTTWQQQQQAMQNQSSDPSSENESADGHGSVMGSQFLNIRLKLEEKRRRIENDKRRMEAVISRQRQKVGKAAFLQAVTKGQGQKTNVKSPESDPGRGTNGDLPDLSEKPQRPFSLQDITEVEQKWLVGENFSEERKTPDIDSMDIETCQQSIAQFNSSLHEIQADLQRLANQQSQMQQHQHQLQHHHQPQPSPQLQQQQPAQVHQQNVPMASFATLHQANYSNNQVPQQMTNLNNQQIHSLIYNNHPSQNQWHSLMSQQPNNYQNDYINLQQTQQNNFINQQQQQQQQIHSLINQQPINSFATLNNQRNFAVNNQQQTGFMLSQQPQSPAPNTAIPHNNFDGYHSVSHQQQISQQQQVNQIIRGDSAGEFYLHDPPTSQRRTWGQPPPDHHNTWNNSHSQQPTSLSSSPHTGGGFMLHHNGGSGDAGYKTSPPSLAPTPPPRRVTHAPLPTPPVDDMEPQSISFIGSGEDELSSGLSRINITSGSRTYRIPSPTRTHTPISRNSFTQQQTPLHHSSQQPQPAPQQSHQKNHQTTPPNTPSHGPAPPTTTEKGFYISFDDDTPPKRPKPPLRVKRASPKKERALTQVLDSGLNTMNQTNQLSNEDLSNMSSQKVEQLFPHPSFTSTPERKPEPPRVPPTGQHSDEENVPGVGLIIGNELVNPDPSTLDEMERKKERILLLSLQRRQAQEEAKARKEAEAARRRENEKRKEEERARKKEEEKARRAAILDQYKLKKAIEEAEREGKLVDKELLNSLKSGGSGGPPKLRGKTTQTRPRPKTIHIDSGADAHDGMLTPSRGKKGSSSNLSVFNQPMRRDYYRGSQDCLAETRRTSGPLYSDLGDDSRGASPGRTLGRRGSYKTSRDASPEQPRVRSNSKYATYQSRRKSNSLMNLSGSSVDQDSLLYRYGDTDSGLGRATPPRRAPSPGQHPPSPSGPGSLPAHRRRYDDTASESGGSEYSGPRLYKQPATKSNKGIILNAVEYCVFPGVVNREAKRRVLEEINRSEAKHFLVLFRDAGCQFRALYSYCPETEEVVKLYGTGPKLVSDRMFDKFFKYNSGGKCFSQVHTKHLTVTIDAFTIHNSLWQGKKVNLPNKKDMTLVI